MTGEHTHTHTGLASSPGYSTQCIQYKPGITIIGTWPWREWAYRVKYLSLLDICESHDCEAPNPETCGAPAGGSAIRDDWSAVQPMATCQTFSPIVALSKQRSGLTRLSTRPSEHVGCLSVEKRGSTRVQLCSISSLDLGSVSAGFGTLWYTVMAFTVSLKLNQYGLDKHAWTWHFSTASECPSLKGPWHTTENQTLKVGFIYSFI